MSLTQGFIRAHAAQGGVTLGLEQGELGGEFLSSWQPEDQAHICDTGQPQEDRVIYRYTKFYPN